MGETKGGGAGLLRGAEEARASAQVMAERLQLALDVGQVATWHVDLATGATTWSTYHFTILGHDPATTRASVGLWERSIHPDDVDRVLGAWRAAIAGHGRYVQEYRIVQPTGDVRWVRAHGRLIRDAAGAPAFDVGALVDVTDLKQAALTEARLAAHAENSPLAIVEWDAEYRVMRWSPAAERMFGWTAAEVVGRRLDELDIVPEPERAQVEAVRRAIDDGTTRSNVSLNRNRRKDGAVIHCAWHNSAIVDEAGRLVSVYAQVLDRTTEVEALEALRQREQHLERQANELRTMLDIVPIGIAISHDPRGEYISVNPALAQMLRLDTRQNASLTGPDRDRIPYRCLRNGVEIPGDDLPMQVASQTGRSVRRDEFDVVFADGEVLKLMVNAAPLFDEDGAVRGAIGAHVDVTSLERARAVAEAASRAKDDFLATVSHELRSPLQGILGCLTLLKRGGLDPGQTARALDAADRSVRLQAQLVHDLMDVSRIVAGKVELERAPLEPSEVVMEVVDGVRPEVAARGLELELDVAPCGPVDGDRARLHQVIANLLSNACKFTPAGGRVTVRCRRDGDAAVVTVADTGEGIAPAFLPHLFERFTQADTSSTRRHGGLGLGLAIVRHLVELHGGTVQAASAGPDRGATFTVRLPATATAASAVARPAATPGRLDGVELVLVEDDRDALEAMSLVLRAAGAAVRPASSVAAAWAACRLRPPHVVVTDLSMPGEDGFGLLRRLRSERVLATCPAVALTGFGRAEDEARVLEAGFAAYVRKPVEPETLVAILRGVLPSGTRDAPAGA